jgi:hypothetical protein
MEHIDDPSQRHRKVSDNSFEILLLGGLSVFLIAITTHVDFDITVAIDIFKIVIVIQTVPVRFFLSGFDIAVIRIVHSFYRLEVAGL